MFIAPKFRRIIFPLTIAALVVAFLLVQSDRLLLDEYPVPNFGFRQKSPDSPHQQYSPEHGNPFKSSKHNTELAFEAALATTPTNDVLFTTTTTTIDTSKSTSNGKSVAADDKAQTDDDGAHKKWKDESPRLFDHRFIYSETKPDKQYWPIVYTGNGTEGINANVIPHPVHAGQWIVVAQREMLEPMIWPSVEMICVAQFSVEGVLRCTQDATILPMPYSIIGRCEGKDLIYNTGGGPRDGRVFFGKDAPYIVYGSQSTYTCLGMWIRDLSTISSEFIFNQSALTSWFRDTTEIRRPLPAQNVEKNYFLFWDSIGVLYAHYEIWPKRSFAQIFPDGTAGADLASATRNHDQTCMARLKIPVPFKSTSAFQTIHQATNSLHITTCNRTDSTCVPNDQNTFIMTIYHYRNYYAFHPIYEPFVTLFRRHSPFSLHAVSTKPFWIWGRTSLTVASYANRYRGKEDSIPDNHSEFFYITSVNWKDLDTTGGGRHDHGYLDDVLLIAFGIEDSRSGVIDVTAKQLLQDLGYC